jgi:hypothetical protein
LHSRVNYRIQVSLIALSTWVNVTHVHTVKCTSSKQLFGELLQSELENYHTDEK